MLGVLSSTRISAFDMCLTITCIVVLFCSFAGGVTITMLTIFALGFAATNAEPALNVLGQTVETLSNGKFTKNALVYAVCVGVAIGMCAGKVVRVQLGLSLRSTLLHCCATCHR